MCYVVKTMQGRNRKGQFDSKSDSKRKVRTIRVTDKVWNEFGEMAFQRSITRADLLEQIVVSNCVILGNDEVVEVLSEALKLKANAGGAIKKKIRDALDILG